MLEFLLCIILAPIAFTMVICMIPSPPTGGYTYKPSIFDTLRMFDENQKE